MSIYEVYFGFWKCLGIEIDVCYFIYKVLVDDLISYVSDMGYIYVELLFIFEFFFDGLWGY